MKTRLFALSIVVFAVIAFAQDNFRDFRIREYTRMGGRTSPIPQSSAAVVPYSYAMFEFAPPTDAGMTAPCACTVPSLPDGGALTFLRASTATCTKGNEWSNIANGDLVACASGEPRVMPGGDGTGVVGLSVFYERTNTTLWSEEIENAYWTAGVGGQTPTVTADYATGPFGGTVADRVQFSATIATQESLVYNLAACPGFGIGLQVSPSVYLKGTSGSGTISMVQGAATACGAGGTLIGSYCFKEMAFNASTWTRYPMEAIDNVNPYLFIGNESALAGHTGSQIAADVLVFGVQCEQGATVSPYIPTTSAAATRIREKPTMGAGTFSGATISIAATAVLGPSLITGETPFQLYKDTNNYTIGYVTSSGATSTFTCDFVIGGVSSTVATAGNLTLSASNRVACYYDGVNKAACLGGVCTTSAAALTLPTGAMTMHIGTRAASQNEIRGVVKLVCADMSASRCI